MQTENTRDLLRQLAKLQAQLGEQSPMPTFGEYARGYMEQKLRNPALREATKRSFRIQVEHHLIPAFGPLPLDRVTNDAWLKWVAAEKRITRFFNARKALVEILLAAKAEGILDRVPKFDNPDEPHNVGRVLEDSEVLRLLRHTLDDQFRFFFYVLWKQGCRPREVLRWEWHMIEFNEPGHSWINVPARISKTGRARSVPLNPSVSRRLYRMLKAGPTSQFVFPHWKDPNRPQLSYHGAWNTACRWAKVNAMPYDLRRTFITRRAAEGKPPIFIAKILDTSVKMLEAVYSKKDARTMEDIVR